jgi:hypothetical protein
VALARPKPEAMGNELIKSTGAGFDSQIIDVSYFFIIDYCI